MMMKMSSTKRQQTFCVMFLLMLTILLISSQDNLGANAQDDCDGGDTCFARCLVRGKCDRCCKQKGYLHGKCSSLTCFCCHN
ncbi:hypothetical protein BDA96_02G168400 [Sorghum bicolor]|uniref:Knottin scorpion toxin-like domain-containing protein n=2 Tax=Sorghum bicolor TaxID=4558 RepID=A0A921RPD1_SORBI|nr:hypothetical protein BDA96_02G168400 [Sorghum bicolor]KXG35346.1 hypothetical protein SORBI_3002G162100 [Sorghum bicolor]